MRYEDIVDDTIGTLKRVYSHLNLPFTKHVENVAFARTHAENITGTNGSGKDNFSKNATLFSERDITTHSEEVLLHTTPGKRNCI